MLALALVLLAAVTVANIELHGRSRVHEGTRAQLNELNVLLHEESSLQWKTLASRNTPVKVARELGAIRLRERDILDKLPGSEGLSKQVSGYHAVLDQELGLLGVGKTAEALALEQGRTDPAFVVLASTLQRLEESETAAADLAKTLADFTLVLAMVAAVAAIGLLLYRFEREHRASMRAREELLRQQQEALDTLAEHEALVRHQAAHDPLTGLPNRRALTELLTGTAGPGARPAGAAGERPAHRALLLVDLDEFKPVNDRLGHAAGDELLVAVAGRLLDAAGDGTVVRLGGDEFAVVLDAEEAAAVAVAERIVAAVAEPFEIAGTSVRIGASVGLATTAQAGDGDRLLREADAAMYRVKQSTKGGFAVSCVMTAR
ncbi:diguanylate cyclase domain-containing protein [Dactylosporangium sp. CS-033363]|uniref:diguanylate cyclase domain-containing protein n=1 Tax=Dactylosporangium sp. CS-033363 TaxID=3239935 RepID=UPI003D8A01A0